MKKIAVNTRLLRKNAMDGIGWVTYNILKELTLSHPEIEFHFLFDSGIENEFLFSKNIVPHNLFPPAKHALLNIVWFEWSAKNLLHKLKPDLFFSPDGILCLGWKGKQYGIVHDVNFVHRPKDLKQTNRIYYNYFIPKSIETACRIGTVSEYSKKDIINVYKTSSDKIDVIHLGINDFFYPLDKPAQQEIKNRFTGGCDYFIFIGTISPRKNINRLMKAFELFKQQTNSNLKLVIAGKEMYRTSELHELKLKLKNGNDIIFTGRLSNDDLSALLASSFCLTFVPLIEGFGLPPVEAMQCDVPVIASNVTSVPEVVGNAGLLVNPFNVDEIRDAMIAIYTNNDLRSTLIERGKERKNQFQWKNTAQEIWISMQKCL
ncbi:MAG TPA: glycosyltransferase family 1 protein [Parafilimonas sp.]|nr:glycosyltransferase family 1 protein [Parafilimonas sp.]